MKIKLVCEICGGILEEYNHSESLVLSEKIIKYSDKKMQIKIPLCKDCANVYMYSGGTMKLETPKVDIEKALG